jgi:hypothetical protein
MVLFHKALFHKQLPRGPMRQTWGQEKVITRLEKEKTPQLAF